MLSAIVTNVLGLLDKIIPDPTARAEAKLKLQQLEGQQAMAEFQLQLQAILAEAQSADPYTSRARPTFLYVIYLVIVLCVVGAVVGIWWPQQVFTASENLNRLLKAVPPDLWTLFGIGYLGYTGARSFEKWRGIK